jgi:hypothetical protein
MSENGLFLPTAGNLSSRRKISQQQMYHPKARQFANELEISYRSL